jgi:hypothetical protein
MTTMQKLFNIEVSDVITMILAIPAVMLLTGGEMNAGGLIGIVIGNRIYSVLVKRA